MVTLAHKQSVREYWTLTLDKRICGCWSDLVSISMHQHKHTINRKLGSAACHRACVGLSARRPTVESPEMGTKEGQPIGIKRGRGLISVREL